MQGKIDGWNKMTKTRKWNEGIAGKKQGQNWWFKAGGGNESLSSSTYHCRDVRRWMRVNQGSIMRHHEVIESHWLTETMAFSITITVSVSVSLSLTWLYLLFSFPNTLLILQQTTSRNNETLEQPSQMAELEFCESILIILFSISDHLPSYLSTLNPFGIWEYISDALCVFHVEVLHSHHLHAWSSSVNQLWVWFAYSVHLGAQSMRVISSDL